MFENYFWFEDLFTLYVGCAVYIKDIWF